MAERRGFRGFLAARRLSWRYFWARRAPWRITLTKLFVFVALLIVVYLVIPGDAQAWVNRALQAAGQLIAALNSVEMLAGAAGVLVVLCLGLVFARPSRRASYLATSPTATPLITVYIDAENQLSASTIPSFKRFLMEHLNGRRADLLYFMDASQASHGSKYKTLYRFGFRPVDVPHDPTGKGDVKEAVDKEIAMHAIERALRGPKKQEFILVTGDGDFVGLVYRLVALGHQVQVWATPIVAAYRTLATYLDVNVLDLASVISERQTQVEQPRAMALTLPAPKSPKTVQPRSARQVKRTNGTPVLSHETHPDIFAYPGEEQLYQAIVRTLRTCLRIDSRPLTDQEKYQQFRAFLGGNLGPRLASVGYSAGSRLDFWIEHLVTLQVLAQRPGKVFPTVGSTSAEAAAKAMFAMAYEAARAAVAVVPARDDGMVQMGEVAAALTDMLPDSAAVGPLRQLVEGSGPRRVTHTRYFVRCARALGLVEFDDVPDSLDVIRSPRLIETPLANESEENGQAETVETANTADDAADADAGTGVVTDADPPAAPDDVVSQEPETPPDDAL